MSNAFLTGRKAGIGTTAVQLRATDTIDIHNVIVVADPNNLVPVYIGDSTVTADADDETDGFPLQPGEDSIWSTRRISLMYGRTASGTAKVWIKGF